MTECIKFFRDWLFPFWMLLCSLQTYAADTLTVEQCRILAVQISPLQQKRAVAETVAAYQLRNLQSNNLPRIQVGAQASWQSEVFGLPIESPFFSVPKVPKDQYKLSIDAAERIYDGNSDRLLRRQRELERDLAIAQVDVDVFTLRETVTDLYAKILLIQESIGVLSISLTDLLNRLKQTEAMVKEGVALRSSADQINIQILKTRQQIGALEVDQQGLKAVLALWIGRNEPDFILDSESPAPAPVLNILRPEHRLFDLQQKSLLLSRDLLKLKSQPRVEAFLQTGLGRPNPFNFFETDFQPFFIIGLRAAWTPLDWGNLKREGQMLAIQANNIEAQKQAFDIRQKASLLRDQAEREKAQGQLRQDEEIITLQKDIVKRAETQFQNGVITATEYLSQINLLIQLEVNKKTHEIQAWQAAEMAKARTE